MRKQIRRAESRILTGAVTGCALGAVKLSGLIARKIAATPNAVTDPVIKRKDKMISLNA